MKEHRYYVVLHPKKCPLRKPKPKQFDIPCLGLIPEGATCNDPLNFPSYCPLAIETEEQRDKRKEVQK